MNRIGSPNPAMTPPAVIASGIELNPAGGGPVIDLIAALTSSVGHRHERVVDAMRRVVETFPGQGGVPPSWLVKPKRAAAADGLSLMAPFAGFSSLEILPSADSANDAAILAARSLAHAKGNARYRIITPLGSDFGQTLACRSASGRFESQAALGPLVAGFRCVPAGDIRAIEKGIDDQTAAIMLAPVDWHRGGAPWDEDYLPKIRELCDASDLLMILDETRLPPAVTGHWHHHQVHGISPDLLTLSAGWTGGLPGGILLSSAHLAAGNETKPAASMLTGGSGLVLLEEAIRATAEAILDAGGPDAVAAIAGPWADGLRELVEAFEFLVEVESVGLWSVVRTDIDARTIATKCLAAGVQVAVTGGTSLLTAPPITLTPSQALDALAKIRDGLEMLERETIES